MKHFIFQYRMINRKAFYIAVFKPSLVGRVWVGLLLFSFSVSAQVDLTTTDVYAGKADITASNSIRLLPGFRAVGGSSVRAYISSAAASYQPIAYNPTSGGTISTGSPNSSTNYIRTYILHSEATVASIISTPRVETIAYFDGLGRPVQTVTVQGSPAKADLVEGIEYDDFGRDYCHFLPFAKASNNGAYVADAKTTGENYYNLAITGHEMTSSPWNKTLYEPSPLNRVIGASGPDAWASKPTSVSYQTNTSAIPHWDINKNPISFPAYSLYLTETTDEDGNKTREYKDKLGQVVRKESYDGTTWLRTAYVYDDFGQLVIVVPPKATSATDAELCYYYAYDERRRMTMKDLPGADPVYMVYDKRDRLVLVQDGVQQPSGKWSFTKYDELNRPVLTGEVVIAGTRDAIAAQFKADLGTLYETTGTALYGYTKQSYPDTYDGAITENNVLTVTYYDGYTFRPSSGYAYQSNLAGEPLAESARTKGLITGTWVKVLPDGETLAVPMALTVMYYDDFGRVVQTVADNRLETTSREVTHTKYNFVGQPVATVTEHRKGNITAQQTLATTLAYDHQGRLLTEKMKINSGNEITLASITYNELGETVARYLHGDASGNNFNQKVDYSYNPKGWLRTVNTPGSLGSDLFALDLRYNTPATGTSLGGAARYNGNIAQMLWDIGTPAGYGFSYDGLNRLKTATYADSASYTSNVGQFSTAYTYDANGNMNSLSRYLDGTQVDNLGYTYLLGGNRLGSITDGTYSPLGYKAVTGSYLYDANGNMTYDVSKGFTIAYNRLNLPQQVSIATDNAKYTYDAAGTKLAKTVTNGTATTTHYYYSGPFMYQNADLLCIFTPEGRVVTLADQPGVFNRFEYNMKDHLGNTRITFTGHADGKPEVNQLTSYDPYGFVTNQTSYYATGASRNKLLYNGKELQDDQLAGTKLDWYDYGARFYDPAIGRWHTPDPMAEKYNSNSPYVYCVNNPILLIDPDGMEWFYYSKDGKSDPTWNWRDEKEYHTGVNDNNGKEVVLQGTEAVVVFNGSRHEKLGTKNGKSGYINGEGAVTASVTVYGPDGADDVHNYTGYTMTSDATKYGAVDEGIYNANYVAVSKRGTLKSHWTLNNRGEVRMLDGEINPSAPDQISSNGEGYKNGIFIHSAWDGNKASGRVSTGCLLISSDYWSKFNSVMSGVQHFKVQLIRTQTERVPLQGVMGSVPNMFILQKTTKY